MHGRVVVQQSSIGLSGIECPGIHGGLQGLGGFFCGGGRRVDGFEPTVFFHLVGGDGGQRWLGPHDDHCLELSVYFPRVAMDEKFADIKFRHVEPSLGDNCTGETWARRAQTSVDGPVWQLLRVGGAVKLSGGRNDRSMRCLQLGFKFLGQFAGLDMAAAKAFYSAAEHFTDVEEVFAGRYDLEKNRIRVPLEAAQAVVLSLALR